MAEDIIFDDYDDEWSSVPSHKEHRGFFTCSSGETFKNFCRRQYRNLTHFLVEDWCLSAVLGIIMAILAVSMDFGIEHLQEWHVELFHMAEKVSKLTAYVAWTGFCVILVFAAALWVHYVAPQGAGSGIPEVKTILRGVMLEEFVTLRAFFSKMVGLILSLGSGLPIGKEGPFVHIAAVVATQISRLTATCSRGVYANESRYTEMLSSACAVAIACTFRAPIGGVLYAIEATSVFFKVSNYWKAFFASCCSAITFRFIGIYIKDSHVHVTSYLQTHFPYDAFLPQEIPYFTLLGIICGFSGALFIFTQRQVAQFAKYNSDFKKINKTNMYLFPLSVALIVSSLTFPLGFGRMIAGTMKQNDWLMDFFSACSWHKTPGALARNLMCSQSLLDRWTGGIDGGIITIFASLSCFVATFFILSQVCYTLPVPAGIFLPVFVIGAAMGRLFGEWISYWHPEGFKGVDEMQIYPGIYAIVGAAAFTGAVTHTVSVAVIVFELTGQITYMLPVLIAVLFANAICMYLQPSIYDSAIKVKKLPYLPELPPSRSSVHSITAEQIMIIDIKYITEKTTYRELRDILAESQKLQSFPVVTDSDSKILLGSVPRRNLIRLLRNKVCMTKAEIDEAKRIKLRSSASDSKMDSSVKSVSIKAERPRSVEIDPRSLSNTSKDKALLSPYSQQSAIEREHNYSGIARSSTTLGKVEDFVSSRTNTYTAGERDDVNVNRLLLRQSSLLDKAVDLTDCIDPAPFQLVENTSLYKVHNLFSRLALNHAYVTASGRLVGVVALKELRRALENIYLLGAIPSRPTRRMTMERVGLHLPSIVLEKGSEDEREHDSTEDNESVVVGLVAERKAAEKNSLLPSEKIMNVEKKAESD